MAAGAEEEAVEARSYDLTSQLLTLKVEHARAGPTIGAEATLAGDLKEMRSRLRLGCCIFDLIFMAKLKENSKINLSNFWNFLKIADGGEMLN